MALTRRMLKAMGIEDDQIEQIIEAHGETVNALKDERDSFKADCERLSDVQEELNRLKDAAKNGGETVPKEDYDAIKDEYKRYKDGVEAEKARTAKETAYRELLKAAGVAEKRIPAIVKVTDIDSIEFDESGKIKDADKRTNNIKTEWAEFIETTTTQGAKTANPPSNSGGTKLTKAEIYARDEHGRYKLSTAERQKALAENPELLN